MSGELPESLDRSKLDTEYEFHARKILGTSAVERVRQREKVQSLQFHMFSLSAKENVIVEDHQPHQKEWS